MENNQTAQQSTDLDQTDQDAAQVSEQPKQIKANADELARRLQAANAEAKEYRQKLSEEKKRREETERQRLENEGKFKELADKYKQEAEESKLHVKSLRDAFAVKTISDQVAIEAQRLGCVDTEVLLGLVDTRSVPVDEQFRVDSTSVKAQLEDLRTKKPFLFKKQAPQVHDVVPGGKVQAKPAQDISKLSKDDIETLLKSGKYK